MDIVLNVFSLMVLLLGVISFLRIASRYGASYGCLGSLLFMWLAAFIIGLVVYYLDDDLIWLVL